ncbi:MAG: lamin tail domain-containing protein [Anaerolineae bacterium]|nr:lamin tail domain-containing protein [Anaerolineae bacterium]NUQ06214.1 lamin tail domain-containing protein [Anaerolineae bacterium]
MRRIPIGYMLLTVIVTLAVTFGAMTYINSRNPQEGPEQIVITVPILVTATPNPDGSPQVIIVTATPLPGTPAIVSLPTGLIETAGAGFATRAPAATLDQTLVASGGAELAGTAAALPPNCVLYTLQEGDTPFAVAQEFGVSGFDLLEVNGLTEESSVFLQIGQTLIIPLEGCELTAALLEATQAGALTPSTTPSPSGTPPTATFTPSQSPMPSSTPTATLPATAVNAQVEIVRVVSPGALTSEGIEIRNNGAVIDLNGWTLRDGQGSTYTFPEQRLFQGGLVTVFTRVGDDTAIALFWDRDAAVLEPGDTLTLSDRNGRVQSTFRVP